MSEQRFADFVAFFLPDLFDKIDWSRRPVFREQELRAITRKTKKGSGVVDRLVQVWLVDGSERWVLIHIEIQSEKDPDLPGRMFRYYFRTYDLFDGKPLTCLAILGDEVPDWRPGDFQAEWWGTKVDFQFRSVKLLDYASQQEMLESSSNPFARFVWAHLKTVQTKGDYETRLQWKLRIIKGLYDMGVSEAEIGQLYHDFDWLLTLPQGLARRYHLEMTTFEEERIMPHMTTAERIGRIDGRKEGRKEGIIAGQLMLLLALLEAKFGALPEAKLTTLQSMSDPQLTQIGIRLLTAQTLEELIP